MVYRLTYARGYPADVAATYDRLLVADLPALFCRRYGPIPPVREVRGQDGVWGVPGQTRTVVMADGGTMHETLLTADRPSSFGYLLTDVTGPLRPLVREVRGRWAVEPAGTGARVTWTWDVEPPGRLGALAAGPLRRLWTVTPARASTCSSRCWWSEPRAGHTIPSRPESADIVTSRVVRRTWGCGAAGSAPRSQ